tara:strand:- start:94 stop:1116 length:1023 start_codon:yes stop_codon:yes gene_type:complete
MDLAPRDQPMATPTETGSELLSTLMEHAEMEEEEFAVEAVLSLDDVSVEIDQYDDSKEEDEDAFQFISGSTPTLSQTVEFETPEEVELDVSDAPSNAVVFDMGDEDPLGEEMEPVHSGLGKLYSPSVKTESDDDLMGSVGPTPTVPSSTPDLPDLTGQSPVNAVALPITQAIATATAAAPIPAPASTPELPDAMDSVTPAYVETPQIPELQEATPELPDVSESETVTPNLPDEAPITPAPEPQNNGRIWPWPAQEPWDPRQVYREVVAILEAIKSGKLPEAAQTLDVLGPHLEHNLDMLLHIGASMRQLGREEHLQWTLAMAKHVHPNNEHVEAAVAHLS